MSLLIILERPFCAAASLSDMLPDGPGAGESLGLILPVFAFSPDSGAGAKPRAEIPELRHALLQPCVCLICLKIIEGMIKRSMVLPASLHRLRVLKLPPGDHALCALIASLRVSAPVAGGRG